MPLFDQFGREIKASTRPESRVMGSVSIRDRYSSYPSDGLTPQKLAAILKEAVQGYVFRQAELFEEMEEKDTHLAGELLKRKNAVNGLEYEIVSFKEGDGRADKTADFCREVVSSLNNFEDSQFDLLDAIGKGFAVSEIKWGLEGSRAVVTGLEWIHQKRFTFVDSLIPKLINENGQGEEIPPFKCVYHRHKARSGHDTRAGITRLCSWMYLFKNYAIKDWVAFAEVFGMPLRVGKYEPGAGSEDKEALISAIRSLGSDAAGIISKNTEIEFVEAAQKAGSVQVFKILTAFCNAEMSKAVIGSTLTTEVGEKGSYAAAKTHNEVRLDLVKSDVRSLSNAWRMQLLRPLVGFNFGWDAPVPWFRFPIQEPEDLKALSEVYGNVVEMGQPISQEHISKRFGIPMPEEGETVLTPQSSGPPTPETLKRLALKSVPERFSQATLDSLSGQAVETAQAAIEALLKPVFEAVSDAGSYREIGAKLYELYPGLNSDEFQILLTKAMFAASLTGYGAAVEDQDN